MVVVIMIWVLEFGILCLQVNGLSCHGFSEKARVALKHRARLWFDRELERRRARGWWLGIVDGGGLRTEDCLYGWDGGTVVIGVMNDAGFMVAGHGLWYGLVIPAWKWAEEGV